MIDQDLLVSDAEWRLLVAEVLGRTVVILDQLCATRQAVMVAAVGLAFIEGLSEELGAMVIPWAKAHAVDAEAEADDAS